MSHIRGSNPGVGSLPRSPYLTRRDGGMYYFQFRLRRLPQQARGQLLRFSLGTRQYPDARRFARKYMVWVLELNDAEILSDRLQIFIKRLADFNCDDDAKGAARLEYRQSWETVVRPILDQMRLLGIRPEGFQKFAHLWAEFVQRNIKLEKQAKGLALDGAYAAGLSDAIRSTSEIRRQSYDMGVSDGFEAVARGADQKSWSQYDAVSPEAKLIETFRGQLVEPSWRPLPVEGNHDENSNAATPGLSVVNPENTPSAVQKTPIAPALAGGGESVSAKKMSDYLGDFLRAEEIRQGHRGAHSDVELYAQFLIDFLGDRHPNDYTKRDWDELSAAICNIPDRPGLPAEFKNPLISRYRFAESHGWAGLKRLSETTIKDRYFSALNRLFNYLIDGDVYTNNKKPKFKLVGNENLVPLPRDSFTDEEVIALISMALFTGCAENNTWETGTYYCQNHIYWAYLILILCGARPGEIGQILIENIVVYHGEIYFDLRLFNPEKGRVARKDTKQLKTENSGRMLLVPRLLVDLGLLERAAELHAVGHTRLFPEWKPYTKTTDVTKWGQPLIRDWQNRKKKEPCLQRKNISGYSGRHTFADDLDSKNISERDKKRLFGHSASVTQNYGNKGFFSAELAAKIQVESPLVQKMREILISAKKRADCGELTILKPWLKIKPPQSEQK
jgi:integrase